MSEQVEYPAYPEILGDGRLNIMNAVAGKFGYGKTSASVVSSTVFGLKHLDCVCNKVFVRL
jgi:hypothetical protein